jgi:hypothetical protein
LSWLIRAVRRSWSRLNVKESWKLADFDQTITYLDRVKQRCFRELASRKKLFFQEEKFFFSTFQFHEMKSINSIFAFNIICFNVYIKFISMLLAFDLVVLVLVIVLDLVFVFVFLYQLQIWDFLLFRQQ